jgi:hypothetical protein
MQVGVETFFGGPPSNNPATSSLNVAPGVTVMFGTANAAGLQVDSILSPGISNNGSARILATSKRLICTAFIADPGSLPPAFVWQLPIINKTTQKGD